MLRRKTSRKPSLIKPTVRIGKRGLTEAQIAEIAKQLDKRKTVKIKVLKSALINETVESIAQKVSLKTGAKVIQIVGHTFTLFKPRKTRK